MTRTAILLPILFSACGGGDEAPPPTAVVSENEGDTLCDEYCAHVDECNWPDAASCASRCDDWTAWMRADVLRYLHDCVTELQCDEIAYTCWQDADNEFTQTAAQDGLVDHCEARLDDCGIADILIDLACHRDDLWSVSDDAVAAADACLDEPCDQIQTCIDDVQQEWQMQ
jgi:hypothetical protein